MNRNRLRLAFFFVLNVLAGHSLAADVPWF